jgi:DNA-binding NarL/FixJ family response regulator
MIDVLIVDDHPVMRELLRQLLQACPNVTIVGEAVTGEEAVRQATYFRPSVALVDLHLATMSGLEATKLITLLCPSTAVIGLTEGEPDHTELAMLNAGARSVVNKADLVHSLYPALLQATKTLKTAI